MRREPYRSVNAARATDEHAARALGYRSQHDLDKDRDRQGKYTDDAARRAIIIPTRTLSFWTEGRTGTTTIAFQRGSKTATPIASGVRFAMGAAGRIIGASIWSTAAWTAGTAQLQARISHGGGSETTYLLSDCIIDGATVDGHTRDQNAEWLCPVANGIRFAAGDELRAVLVLTGWTVSSPDFLCDLIVAYDGLS